VALNSGAWRDVELARVEVPRFAREVGAARGWTAEQIDRAVSDSDAAYAVADSSTYFGADLRTYWSDLAARVNAGPYATWPGGEAYASVVFGALETLDAEEAQRARSSWTGALLGGLGAAGGALGDAGKQTLDRVTDWRWIAGVAAIVIGVVVIQGRLGRR
jgi:hypothetical protein